MSNLPNWARRAAHMERCLGQTPLYDWPENVPSKLNLFRYVEVLIRAVIQAQRHLAPRS